MELVLCAAAVSVYELDISSQKLAPRRVVWKQEEGGLSELSAVPSNRTLEPIRLEAWKHLVRKRNNIRYSSRMEEDML